MNIVCIKLISNSNQKLLDTQLEVLSKKLNIPFDYLKQFKKKGYSKIWIEQFEQSGELVAKTLNGTILIEYNYKSKVTPELLESIKPIVNPKRVGEDVVEEPVHIEAKLKDIICIRLSLDEKSLTNIGNFYGIDTDYLISSKYNGCKLLWLQLGQDEFVCALDTDDMQDVYFNEVYLPMTLKVKKAILNLQPVKTPKATKVNNSNKTFEPVVESTKSIEFNLDSILDKISAKGMASLTKQEKDFLDKISKS